MKLIDKDALVAEIEKRINFNEKLNAHSRLDEYNAILSFINTLEVKEVDLEKEIQNIIHKRFHDYYGIVNSDTGEFAKVEDMVQIAKYFFELGLKAQKGEKI